MAATLLAVLSASAAAVLDNAGRLERLGAICRWQAEAPPGAGGAD
jgi:hypothetical protein